MSTGIQWTDRTWNPITGCTRVSAGCANCYAQTLHNRRYRFNVMAAREQDEYRSKHAPTAIHRIRSLGPSRLPFPHQYDTPFAMVQTWEHKLLEPLHWRKPQRVFVNSMSDIFHEQVPDEFLDRIFAVMALTPHITYQVLTKRPERMREYLLDMGRHYVGAVDGEYMERWGDAAVELTGDPCSAGGPIEDCGWPLPNVWLGVSVEDQDAADERIPVLLDTPAAVRFLSCEPLLGSIALTRAGWCQDARGRRDWSEDAQQRPIRPGQFSGVHWVVVGGESGPKARPCDISWIRDLLGQCQAAEVPVFVKQVSKNPIDGGHVMPMKHSHGGDPNEWPADLRVREFPR